MAQELGENGAVAQDACACAHEEVAARVGAGERVIRKIRGGERAMGGNEGRRGGGRARACASASPVSSSAFFAS